MIPPAAAITEKNKPSVKSFSRDGDARRRVPVALSFHDDAITIERGAITHVAQAIKRTKTLPSCDRQRGR
jgi:hypothetical protein